MIIEIQRNENEFMTIDLAKIDDEDIANEARERDYIVQTFKESVSIKLIRQRIDLAHPVY